MIKHDDIPDFRTATLTTGEEDQLQRVFETARIGGKDWEWLKDAINLFFTSAVVSAEKAVRQG